MNNTHAMDAADASCAREAIHLVGAIQPDGWLIVADVENFTISHVSANIGELFADGSNGLLAAPLTHYLDQRLVDICLAHGAAAVELGSAQHVGQHNIGDMAQLCDVSVHCIDGLLQIEIELAPEQAVSLGFTARAHAIAMRSAGEPDLATFADEMVAQLRALTGFDRVMAYRFLPDASGVVMAESCAEGMEPWLGQRYPASDIPAQARALYLKNRIRVVADTAYRPVPILAAQQPAAQPLDMSYNVLRSLSPIDMQYLRNMGVAASMSVSVVFDGQLWGMLLFQHRQPRRVSAEARNSLELLGAFFSVRVAAHVQAQKQAALNRLDDIFAMLDARLGKPAGLDDELPLIARLLRNDGLVVLRGGEWAASAAALNPEESSAIKAWLATHPGQRILHGQQADWRGEVDADSDVAGVMALRLAAGQADWLLFLRRPYDEEIRWAGIPDKQVEQAEDGSLRIAPRADFSVWRELRRGAGEAWLDDELAIIQRLADLLDARLTTPD